MVYIPDWTVSIEGTDIKPIRVSVEFKLNEVNKIYFQTTKSNYDSGLIAKYKRFQLSLGSWNIGTFIITKIVIQDDELVNVYGFEIAYILDDEIFWWDQGQEDKTDVFFNLNASEILDKLLQGTSFNKGSCPTDTVTVEFRGMTRLSCIKKLAQILGKDWWITDYDVYIGDKGSNKGTLSKYRIIQREYNYENIINKIYLRRTNGGIIWVDEANGIDYVEDTTSQSDYKLRTAVYVASASMDDDTAINEATELLNSYKEPKTVLDVRTTLEQIEDLELIEGDTVTIDGTDYRVNKFVLSNKYEVRLDLESIQATLTNTLEKTNEVLNEHRILLTKVWDLNRVPGSLTPTQGGFDLGKDESEKRWNDLFMDGIIKKPSEIYMSGASKPWKYRHRVVVNSGSDETDVVVSVTLDTASLVSAGKMQSDGSDIRFSTDSDMKNLCKYWIKSGMNTSSTVIYVRMDSLSSGDNDLYLWYGNPNATAMSSMTDTLIYSDNVVTNGGFETGDLSEWTAPVDESNAPVVRSQAQFIHSGSYGLELDYWDLTSRKPADMKQSFSDEIYPNQLSFYYKNDGSDTVVAKVVYKDATYTSFSFGSSKTDWTQVILGCNNTKQVDYVYFDRSTSSSDITYLDDVKLSGWVAVFPSSYSVDKTTYSEEDLSTPSKIHSESYVRILSSDSVDLFSVGTESTEKFKVNVDGEISTESVIPDSIKADNSPSDGYVPSYRASTGNFYWVDVSGSATDEKVKADSGDPTPGYLDAKVDGNSITVDTGSHVLKALVDSSTLTIDTSNHYMKVLNSPKWNGYYMSDDLSLGGDVSVGGDLKVGSNYIRDSSGTIRITLGSTNQVTGGLSVSGSGSFGGDISVLGNDIKDSGGTSRITLGSTITLNGDVKVSGNDILMSTGRNAFNFDTSGLQINTWNNFMLKETGTSNSTTTTYDSYKQKFRGTYWDGSSSQTYDAQIYLKMTGTGPDAELSFSLGSDEVFRITNTPTAYFGKSGVTNRFNWASKDGTGYAGLYTTGSSNRLYVRAENTDDIAEFTDYGIYLPKNTTYGVYVGGGIELAYADSGKRLDFLKTPSYISYGNGNVIFTIQDPLILHRKMEPNVDNSKELGTWSSKRWYSVNTYRVKTVHINCDIDQDLNIFYNSPNLGSRILRIGRHASDASNTSYDSPKLRLQGSYWNSSVSVDSYWDLWNDVSTSSAILKFDYNGSNKMWLRHDGKLWLSGYLQLGNNQIMDSSGTVRVTVGSTTTINGDLKVSGNDILDSGGTKRITLGSTTSIWAYDYVNIYNTKYSSSTPMMKIYYDTAKRVQIYTHWLTVEENNTSDKLGVTFKTTGNGQCPGFYWEYAYTSPRHIVREWFRGDLSTQEIDWEWYNGSSYQKKIWFDNDGKVHAIGGFYTSTPKYSKKNMIQLMGEIANEFLKREAPKKDDGTFDDPDMQLIEDELPGGEKTYRVEYSQEFLDRYAKDISKMAIISGVLINFLIALLVKKGIITTEELKKLEVK